MTVQCNEYFKTKELFPNSNTHNTLSKQRIANSTVGNRLTLVVEELPWRRLTCKTQTCLSSLCYSANPAPGVIKKKFRPT